MGERGGVHTFHPTWTKKDPVTGERTRHTSESWGWRFEYRGKRYAEVNKDWTRQQAREAGMERYREVKAGREDDPRRTTFETLAAIITSEYRLKKLHTQHVLRSSLKKLRGFFGADLAMEIARPRLIDYFQARESAGAAKATVALELRYLRRAMSLAEEQGRLLRVPKFPPLPRTVRRVFFREDEVAALVEHLPPHARGVVLAASETGWRMRSEILTRQWKHVDFQGGWLRLEKGEAKNGDPRAIPLTSALRDILTGQRALVDGLEAGGRIVPWVFPGPDGERQEDIQEAWRAGCLAVGLDNRRPHDLRRTAAMRLSSILSQSQCMAWLGHRSPGVHLDYIQTDARSLLQARELIEAARAVPAKVARIRKR